MALALARVPDGNTAERGTWSRVVPGWLRGGIEVCSAAQGVLLDLFSLQNASILNAVRRGVAPSDVGPAGEAACEALRGVVQVHTVLLSLTQRQNGILSSALAGAMPGAAGIVEAFSAAIGSLVDAQQGLLAIVERETDAWLAPDGHGKSAGELLREALQHLARTRTTMLGVLKGMPTHRVHPGHRRIEPALYDVAHETVAALADAQKDLLRVLRRQTRIALSATRRTIDPALPAIEAADLWTAAEYLLLHAAPVYYGIGVPRGDNSAVLLVPGFLSADLYLLELYAWLRRIGYRPYFSGIGLNAECPDLLVKQRLNHTIERALQETGRRIHIIGHSLGGVIARSVACQRPSDVASIITLGAPYRDGGVLHSRALQAAEIVRQRILLEHGPGVLGECYTGRCSCDFVRCVRFGLGSSVLQTAVFTRDDRVVDWRYCATGDPGIDVEVPGTHAGLVFNPLVFETIGARLASARGNTRRQRRKPAVPRHRLKITTKDAQNSRNQAK